MATYENKGILFKGADRAPHPAMLNFLGAWIAMTLRCQLGFTLIELMIIIVLIAILAGTVLAFYGTTTQDARTNTLLFNLTTLRSRVETYKTDHDGLAPAALEFLAARTNRWGTTDASDGVLHYGPYLPKIPVNPLADVSFNDVVKPPATNPPVATVAGAGWLYDPNTGDVWINHADFLNE